jgi:hypothetical protein
VIASQQRPLFQAGIPLFGVVRGRRDSDVISPRGLLRSAAMSKRNRPTTAAEAAHRSRRHAYRSAMNSPEGRAARAAGGKSVAAPKAAAARKAGTAPAPKAAAPAPKPAAAPAPAAAAKPAAAPKPTGEA